MSSKYFILANQYDERNSLVLCIFLKHVNLSNDHISTENGVLKYFRVKSYSLFLFRNDSGF